MSGRDPSGRGAGLTREPRSAARPRAASAALLALAALGSCSAPAPAGPRVLAEAPVRLALRSGVPPTAAAVVDGRPDLVFLLDSGSTSSWIDARRAAESGLELKSYSGPGSAVSSEGKTVTFDRYVDVGRLELGAAVFEGLRVPVLEMEVCLANGWYGILGQDVLALLPIVLDAGRSELHLLPPSTDREGIRSYLETAEIGKGKWAVIEADYRPCPYLSLAVVAGEQHEREIEIDTGATHTSFPKPVIEALRLEPVGTFTTRTLAGTREGRNYRLPQLGLFGLEISAEIQDNELDYGLLGMDILGELVVVLDGPGGLLWLHHRARAPLQEER